MDLFLAFVLVSIFNCPIHGLLLYTQVLGWEMYLLGMALLSNAIFLSLFFLQNHVVIEEADSLCVVLSSFGPCWLQSGLCSLEALEMISSMLLQALNCTLFHSPFLWDLLSVSILMTTSLLEYVPSFWILPQNSITRSLVPLHLFIQDPNTNLLIFSIKKKNLRNWTPNVASSPKALNLPLLRSYKSFDLFFKKKNLSPCKFRITLRQIPRKQLCHMGWGWG